MGGGIVQTTTNSTGVNMSSGSISVIGSQSPMNQLKATTGGLPKILHREEIQHPDQEIAWVYEYDETYAYDLWWVQNQSFELIGNPMLCIETMHTNWCLV